MNNKNEKNEIILYQGLLIEKGLLDEAKFFYKEHPVKPWPRNPLYGVNEFGDVYKLDSHGVPTLLNQVLHSPGKSHQLYRYVNVLDDDGQNHGYPVHRILFETFGPKEPNDGKRHVVSHRNHRSLDNRLSNLEWATWSKNLNESDAKLNAKTTRIIASRRKGPVTAISPDGNELEFKSVFEASTMLGIPSGWISNILKGKGKSARGFSFRRDF